MPVREASREVVVAKHGRAVGKITTEQALEVVNRTLIRGTTELPGAIFVDACRGVTRVRRASARAVLAARGVGVLKVKLISQIPWSDASRSRSKPRCSVGLQLWNHKITILPAFQFSFCVWHLFVAIIPIYRWLTFTSGFTASKSIRMYMYVYVLL